MYELKIYRGVITMKNDAKLEEELNCRFKIDTKILQMSKFALGQIWALFDQSI